MYTNIESLSYQETAIANEIIKHANEEGSHKANWYVGIASEPRDRLFDGHNVQEKSWWIFRDAKTDTSARKIEKYLIDSFGFDGGGGGGGYTTKFVYAYRKTHTTNP